MIELEVEDLNETEMRHLYAQFGVRFPRSLNPEEIEESFNSGNPTVLTDQQRIREQTQKFVQKNWEHLKVIAEVYACTGDCAEPSNRCTAARAITCFHECFPNKKRRSANG